MNDIKLKPKIKKLWVDALRSGNYEQGRGALCYDGKYCCLGVLCDLHRIKVMKKGTSLWQKEEDNTNLYYCGSAGFLPKNVIKWAVRGKIPALFNPYIESECAGLVGINDSGNIDFNKIADLIEKNL